MAAAPQTDPKAGGEAMAFRRETLVFDCTKLLYAVDEPYASRLKEGGVDVVNLTTVAETEGWDDTLKITETALKTIEKSPIQVQATNAVEVRAAKRAGKIAVILGTQGASMLDTQHWRLEVLHRLGYRYFGLAYTGANVFADGCGAGSRGPGGVSPFSGFGAAFGSGFSFFFGVRSSDPLSSLFMLPHESPFISRSQSS